MNSLNGKKSNGMAAYLLILLLISAKFFYIRPFNFVMTGYFPAMIYLIWLMLGHFMFKPQKHWLTITHNRHSWPAMLFLLAVLLSFISARKFFGQGFVTSFIASREMLSLLTLPLLFAIRPDLRDIEKAASWFTVAIVATSILDALSIPILDRTALMPEDSTMEYIEEGTFVHLLPGSHWVGVALMFKLGRLHKAFTTRNILTVIGYLAVLVLFQNRTMLFSCAFATLVTFLTLQGRKRTNTILFRAITLVLFAVLIAGTGAMWSKLLTETSTQLSNDDYNRVKAVAYFFTDGNHGTLGTILGNGFISAKTSNIMKELMQNGIYNSDVGFIGMWNYYGLIPVIVLLTTFFMGLFGRKSSYMLRAQAFFMLACTLTIACFDGLEKIAWLCAYLYMLGISRQPQKTS